MPDIRLVPTQAPWLRDATGSIPYSISSDWSLLSDGTLDDDQALATAVMIALGTNRLAGVLEDDILPDPDSNDRAGWWGDMDAEEIHGGWPLGSRLWLLRRSKIVGAGTEDGPTLVHVEYYIREAIQPFIDQRIASAFDVEARQTGTEKIEALITIWRGPRRPVDLRFEILWNEIERA